MCSAGAKLQSCIRGEKRRWASKELRVGRYLLGDMFDKFFTKFRLQRLIKGDLSWTDAVNPQGDY